MIYVIEQLWGYSFGGDKAISGYKPIGYASSLEEAKAICGNQLMNFDTYSLPERQYYALDDIAAMARADDAAATRFKEWQIKEEARKIVNAFDATTIADYLENHRIS